MKKAWEDPELRSKRIASMTEAQNRLEVKAKISAAVKKWQASKTPEEQKAIGEKRWVTRRANEAKKKAEACES